MAPADRSLLDRLFALGEDLAILASETRRSLTDLHLWAASPAIAAVIDLHRCHTAAARREAALSALHDVLACSEDPIELRRTACAVLRWLNAPRVREAPDPSAQPVGVPSQPAVPRSEPLDDRGCAEPSHPGGPPPEYPSEASRTGEGLAPRASRLAAAAASLLTPFSRADRQHLPPAPGATATRLLSSAGAPGLPHGADSG